MAALRDRLKMVASLARGWAELRYHDRRSRVLGIRKGEISEMSSKQYEGVGIRVLNQGTWGFASTSDLSQEGLVRALKSAERLAEELSSRKRAKVTLPAVKTLARGDFADEGFEQLKNKSLEEKFDLVRSSELQIRKTSTAIQSAMCQYSEVFEEKFVITTDGADAHIQLARPELRFIAFAADGAQRTAGHDSVGGTGGWECLFMNRSVDQFIQNAAQSAIDLLKAKPARGGKTRVILSPSMVGLLCHEAIGHTVEADFVSSGSVAAGKINQEVASPLITMCDSGHSEFVAGAGGALPVDDEGILTQNTKIITGGILTSYLHNRESATKFGVEPTGNARAWEFSDEPLIRMRNTYIEPGTSELNEMISGIEDGYFIDGPEGGQADATGEFMFGANKVRTIVNGKLGEIVQKITISGIAFDVLKSVDSVSKDFKWDLGSGHCGKGQPAKVDAGGPFLRCEVLLGGQQ